MKITEKIYDVTTGEETFIEREETPEEAQARLNEVAKIEAQKAEAQAKADAKAAIAERLGLSADELATLLG
jgi:hypothetical protein